MIRREEITPEMARAELARREAAKKELLNREALQNQLGQRGVSADETQSQGLLDKLGFHPDMKLRNPLDLIKQDVNQASKFATSPGIRGLQGAQDAIRSAMTLGLVPIKPQGEGTAYNIGKGIGELGAFAGGGELADLARLGLTGARAGQIPGIKQGLQFLEKSPEIKRLLGATSFGAIAEPEDRLKGALTGLGLGGAGEAIRAGSKLIESLRPGEHAKNLLETLGNNASLEENAKSIASAIKNKAEEIKNIGKEKYDAIFNDSNNLGKRRILSSNEKEKSSLIPKDISETFDRKLESLNKDFSESPTLGNAQDLQSQLGTTIRKLKKMDNEGKLSIADRRIMQGYEQAQNTVKDQISNFLSNAEQEYNIPYKNLYDEASQYHLENVIPYKESPNISKISKGKITNPRNIQNIFKNPEENIQKITEDLGNDFKNKILYAELGKHKQGLDPEKLLKNIEKLDEKGLSHYVSPETSELVSALENKLRNRNIARNVAGVVGGAALGGLAPIPYAKEIGGLGGYFLAPHIGKILSKIAR